MAARKLRWRPGRETLTETEALWQYLLDHTRPHETLGYIATFSFRDKESFLRSINARAIGKYRYTLEEIDQHNKIKVKKTKKGIKRKIKKILRNLINTNSSTSNLHLAVLPIQT